MKSTIHTECEQLENLSCVATNSKYLISVKKYLNNVNLRDVSMCVRMCVCVCVCVCMCVRVRERDVRSVCGPTRCSNLLICHGPIIDISFLKRLHDNR